MCWLWRFAVGRTSRRRFLSSRSASRSTGRRRVGRDTSSHHPEATFEGDVRTSRKARPDDKQVQKCGSCCSKNGGGSGELCFNCGERLPSWNREDKSWTQGWLCRRPRSHRPLCYQILVVGREVYVSGVFSLCTNYPSGASSRGDSMEPGQANTNKRTESMYEPVCRLCLVW